MLSGTARLLQKADEFARAPFGYENPPLQIASDILQIPALYRTMENISYGSPLTYGTGQARQLTRDTKGAAEAALNLLPAASSLVRATKGMPVGMIVKPKGNLNFTPSVLAEHLKGPDKQKLGDFIKQIKGMKGLTKEGKQSTLYTLEQLDPNKVVTKQFIEDRFEPSWYSKIDLKGAASDAEAHLAVEAENRVYGDETMPHRFAEYLGLENLDEKAIQALDDLKYLNNEADRAVIHDMLTKDFSPETIARLKELNILSYEDDVDTRFLNNLYDEFAHNRVDQELEYLRMNYEPSDEYAYADYQRLTKPGIGEYVEMGVTHPDAPALYRHYEEATEPMVAHFRGTSEAQRAASHPGIDWSGLRGEVKYLDLDPNSFLIEELQSDAQKGIKQIGPLHQAHATAFKAAVQHALEQGHDTVYLPTAKTIAHVRGEETASFAPIYDQEVINYGLAPLSRMKGVSVEPVTVDDITAYHKIKIDPEAAKEILEGKGQSVPGFAAGGAILMAGGGTPKSKDKQEFRATPRAPVKGAIADAFQDLHTNYLRKQFGFDNPVTEAISEFLGIPAFAKMMDNLSYGESPFKGKGETLQLKPWAVEGLASLPAGAAANTGLKFVKNLPAAIKHGATEFAKASAGTRSQVIRQKGSQTVPGTFESSLQDLKLKSSYGLGRMPEEELPILEKRVADKIAAGGLSEEWLNAANRGLNEMRGKAAINKWIEGPLTKYIKRDMGTPDDPIRKLADEGIVHTDLMADEELQRVYPHIEQERRRAGFSGLGEAETPAGRAFENLADASVGVPARAGGTGTNDFYFVTGEYAPPWFNALPEGTPVYAPRVNAMDFHKIVDTLDDAIKSGAIRPDQLSKVSISDAVRMTHNLEQRKIAEEAERMQKHFPKHKQYQSGFQWVELKANPAETPEDLIPEARKLYENYLASGNSEKTALKQANAHHMEVLTEQALKREGEAMSHCVGTYCEPVMSGGTKVFSLRDPKGRSHVTIEANRPTADEIYDDVSWSLSESLERKPTPEEIDYAIEDYINNVPWRIEQIKGKGNAAPIEDYQPYVADFVRSGQWSPQVGNFDYTDLMRLGNRYIRRSELEDITKQLGYTPPNPSQLPRGITWLDWLVSRDPSMLTEADQEVLQAVRQFKPPEYKKGGAIRMAGGGTPPSPFEDIEPTFGQKAGAYLSDKLTEGLISAYDMLADRDKLSAAHKIYLDTFSRGERGPITQADFKPEEMAELQNLIRQKEAATGGKGTGYIQYEDYKTLPGGDQRRGHLASSVSGVMPPRPALANSLGQFNYKRDPKTGQYKIIDEYDFNPQQTTYQGKKVDIPPDFYGDYVTDSGFSPWRLARLYGGRKMPPGTGRKVDLSVDLRAKYFGK